MKAEELRIGNWVNLYDDFNSQVTGLTNTKKVWCVKNPHDENCAWEADKIKPIPLTEKWLLKFGWGKSDDHELGDNSNENFGFYYDYHFNVFRLECDTELNGCDFNLPIKYVHQLQNLYFALTNEEI